MKAIKTMQLDHDEDLHLYVVLTYGGKCYASHDAFKDSERTSEQFEYVGRCRIAGARNTLVDLGIIPDKVDDEE